MIAEYLIETISKVYKENPEIKVWVESLPKLEDVVDLKKYQKNCNREV